MAKTSLDQTKTGIEQGVEDLDGKEQVAVEGINNAEGNLRMIEENVHQIELIDVIENVIEHTRKEIPNIQKIVGSKNDQLKSKAFEENLQVQENTKVMNDSIAILENLRKGIDTRTDEGRQLSGTPDSARGSLDQMNQMIDYHEKVIQDKLDSNRKIAQGIANLTIR